MVSIRGSPCLSFCCMSKKLSPVSYQELVKVFEADSFRLTRERGDHMVFTKPGVTRPVVIPGYDPVPVFIIKNNLRSAGMSRERFLNFSIYSENGRFVIYQNGIPAALVPFYVMRMLAILKRRSFVAD